MSAATVTRALGYVRVSTDEQAESGAGLQAQRLKIREECTRQGWELVEIIGEDRGASAKTLERAGLQRALSTMDRHAADVLVVAKLDRLSRSLLQGVEVMDRAERHRWGLVALDFGLDTTTPAGQMVAHVLLAMAQYERRLIGQRTREGLAQKRESGRRLGGPATLPDAVVSRIVDERARGLSLPTIATRLELDEVPTASGRRHWQVSSVVGVLESRAAASRVLGPELVARIIGERDAGRSLQKIAEGLEADDVPRPGGNSQRARGWYLTAVSAVCAEHAGGWAPKPDELAGATS